jgi:hypothetical protein
MRPARLYTSRGKTQTIAAWARELGLLEVTLRKRLKSGIPPSRALVAGHLRSPREIQLEYRGKRQSLAAWARAVGITPSGLRWRLRLGVPVARALDPAPLPRNAPQKGRLLTARGKTQSITAWARELGISRQALDQRLQQNPVAIALRKKVSGLARGGTRA